MAPPKEMTCVECEKKAIECEVDICKVCAKSFCKLDYDKEEQCGTNCAYCDVNMCFDCANEGQNLEEEDIKCPDCDDE